MKYIDADKKSVKEMMDSLNEKIAKATESWKGVDVDEFMDEMRGREPEVDLEKDVSSWFFNEISSKINVEHTMYHYFQECARRYYELGKNSK